MQDSLYQDTTVLMKTRRYSEIILLTRFMEQTTKVTEPSSMLILEILSSRPVCKEVISPHGNAIIKVLMLSPKLRLLS
jgi:hypothetical protein